jgi:ATP-dependent protease ClpP protease subunit
LKTKIKSLKNSTLNIVPFPIKIDRLKPLKSHPTTYVFHGELTWENVGSATTILYEEYLQEPFEKLLLPIMSPGGDTDAAWSLYTSLKNLGPRIVTLGIGRVYSAAVIPFLLGEKRYANPETVFLFHPIVIPSSKEEQQLYQVYENVDGVRLDNLMFRRILSKMLNGSSKRKLSNLLSPSKSTYIDANTALNLGLVTDIITSISDISF